VAFGILPLFALANAGIPMVAARFEPTVTTAIFLVFVAGKPLGVILFSFLVATRYSSERIVVGPTGGRGPSDRHRFHHGAVHWRSSFDAEHPTSVKLGVLCASAMSAVFGLLALMWLTSGGHAREPGNWLLAVCGGL